MELQTAGKRKEAVDAYTKALAANPRFSQALLGRGMARILLDKLADAKIDIDAALDNEPGYPAALNARGAIYFIERDLDPAAKLLKYAIAAAPNDPCAYINRAHVRFELQEKPGAIDDLKQALRLDPKNALAQAYLNEIDPPSANEGLKQSFKDLGSLLKDPFHSQRKKDLSQVALPATPPPPSSTVQKSAAPTMEAAPPVTTPQPEAPTQQPRKVEARAPSVDANAPKPDVEQQSVARVVGQLCDALNAKDAARSADMFVPDVHDAYLIAFKKSADKMPALAAQLKSASITYLSPERVSSGDQHYRSAELTVQDKTVKWIVQLVKLDGRWLFATL